MMRLSASGLDCVRGSRGVFRAGLIQPAGGTIMLQGGDADLSVGEQAHYLAHLDALKASLTVSENLSFWTCYLDAGTAAVPALDMGGLETLADLPAAYLSARPRRRLSLFLPV